MKGVKMRKTARYCLWLCILGFSTLFWNAPAEAKKRSWSVRLAAQFDVKPGKQTAFALGTENQYKVGGPMWFAFGTRLQVNDKYFGWTIEPGLIAKIELDGGFAPTFRAMFLMGSKHIFDDWDYFYFYMGSSFGPGFVYDFEDAAIGFEVIFDVAKYVRYHSPDNKKPVLFSVLTGLVLQF